MKKYVTNLTFPLILLLLVIETGNIFAVGALFVRPRGSSTQYQKMWIKNISADIDLDEQIAVTHIDQTFFNELNQSVESIYIFPLPEDAVITELVYWVNGVRFVAEVRERQEAVNAYNQKLHQWLDPALLEYLGDNLFRLSIVPINPLSEVRTEITYIEPLKYDFGIVNYEFKLNTLGLSSKPLEKVTLNLDAKSKNAFESFKSPSHVSSTATQIVEISNNHYKLFFGDENFYPDKDLSIEYTTKRENIEFKVLTYTPSASDSIGDDSFYALWITSPDVIDSNEVIPQNIVFTADVSSSMEGTRIEQLKEAMNNFIDLLNPYDKFNIITFGTFVEKFNADLIPATSENKILAKEFVDKLYALGLTNVHDAITASLQQSFGEESHNNLIFLTDGKPTWGVTNPDSIITHSQNENKNGVRIFSFGLGEEISKSLLNNLSLSNNGYSTFIENDDRIALVVGNLFRRISKPVLAEINISLGGLDAWDFYPKTISDLFWGTQILYLGRYKNSGSFNVTLSGKVKNGEFNYTNTINFPDSIGGHQFVPRLWAKEKIDYLLWMITLYGENQELIDQVIELSLTYNILTPYTALYVDPDATDVDDKDLVAKSFKLHQNYPNPFNPSTTIKYELSDGSSGNNVTLKIFNSLGQLVKVLVNSSQPAGLYSVVWNGKDMRGNDMPSGIYFYTLEINGNKLTKKMMLLR